MNDEAFIDKVVARVLAMLSGDPVELAPRHVLMLFSGASTGFVVGMESIRRLSGSPHSLTVVLSPSAAQIITEAHVRKAGAATIIGPTEWADAPGLVRAADLVLLPTLSMSMASRLALGLMDSLVTTLVLGALLAGKAVVAIRDGAEPSGMGGEIFGADQGPASPLRTRLDAHLATLTSFGVELVYEPEFLLTVERRLLSGAARAPVVALAPANSPRPAWAAAQPNGAQGGFITESDLLSLAPGSSLRLAPGSRLTPQAQDTAQRLRLALIES